MSRVLIGGKFNRVHPGHVWLLQQAKKLGTLVVVLAHDAHNKRPYAMPAEERQRRMERLGIADKVVVGRPGGFVETLYEIKPDIIVLGYDQELPEDAAGAVRESGIRVVRMKKFGDYRTRDLQ